MSVESVTCTPRPRGLGVAYNPLSEALHIRGIYRGPFVGLGLIAALGELVG